MTSDTSHADSQNHRLADALDRLAGVLEQQARGLEALRAEVGALGDAVNRVETRLAGLEAASRSTPVAASATDEAKPGKPPSKKRRK